MTPTYIHNITRISFNDSKDSQLLDVVNFDQFEQIMSKHGRLLRFLGNPNLEVENINQKREVIVAFGHRYFELVQYFMLGIYRSLQKQMEIPLTFEWSEQIFNEKAMEEMQDWKLITYAPRVFYQIRSHFSLSHDHFMYCLGSEITLGNILLGRLVTLEEVVSTGRSGSFFFRSADGKYLIKSLPPEEHAFFFEKSVLLLSSLSNIPIINVLNSIL